MRRLATAILVACSAVALTDAQAPSGAPFTVEQVLSLPTPDNLIASPVGATIAWTFNERGVRNIYAADGPGFAARKLTNNKDDDGQELTNLSFSNDGKYDRLRARRRSRRHPAGRCAKPSCRAGRAEDAGVGRRGRGRRRAEAARRRRCTPVISPDSTRVAFTRDGKSSSLRSTERKQAETRRPLFTLAATANRRRGRPTARRSRSSSNRGDHSFIGLFTPGQPIRYINPGRRATKIPCGRWTARRSRSRVRQAPAARRAIPLEEPRAVVVDHGRRVASPDDAMTVATSGDPIDQIARSPVGLNVRWAADDTLVYFSYRDGWQHLYAITHPGKDSKPMLLTPGNFMVEQVAFSPDHRTIVYNANPGATPPTSIAVICIRSRSAVRSRRPSPPAAASSGIRS